MNLKYESLGFVELPNFVDAVNLLDIMLKSADVKFLTWEKKLGGRLVTIIISGSVSSITESVEIAETQGTVVSSYIIANPHEETIKLVELSINRQLFNNFYE